ncbi:MAG: hypothetical protein HW405_457 [Candidatus Berkelbacteria bacterium]|nr:hypothetical protein [Candidatus Berkelbacteria bacterium]
MPATLTGYVPLSREDQHRVELATRAALELDNLRLGQLDVGGGSIMELVAWFEENFRTGDQFEATQVVCLHKVTVRMGFLSENAQHVDFLNEAIGHIEILLRGIAAEPERARKSICTIERMCDFCLALARA